jgi:hypothetical protein
LSKSATDVPGDTGRDCPLRTIVTSCASEFTDVSLDRGPEPRWGRNSPSPFAREAAFLLFPSPVEGFASKLTSLKRKRRNETTFSRVSLRLRFRLVFETPSFEAKPRRGRGRKRGESEFIGAE